LKPKYPEESRVVWSERELIREIELKRRKVKKIIITILAQNSTGG